LSTKGCGKFRRAKSQESAHIARVLGGNQVSTKHVNESTVDFRPDVVELGNESVLEPIDGYFRKEDDQSGCENAIDDSERRDNGNGDIGCWQGRKGRPGNFDEVSKGNDGQEKG
jgi:hypothetical protein